MSTQVRAINMHQLFCALAPMTSLTYINLSLDELIAEPAVDQNNPTNHLAPLPSLVAMNTFIVSSHGQAAAMLPQRIAGYGVNRLFPSVTTGIEMRYPTPEVVEQEARQVHRLLAEYVPEVAHIYANRFIPNQGI